MRNTPFLFVIIFLCFISFNNSYADDSLPFASTAPVQSPDQFIFSLGRLSISNDFASRNPLSSSYAMFECAASNTHNRKRGRYEIDYESYQCLLRYEKGIFNSSRISVSMGSLHTGSGIFDSAIRNWHNIFSLSNGPRRADNQNDYRAEGFLDNNGQFSIERESFGITDPVIALSIPLLRITPESVIYFENTLSVPLGLSKFSLSRPEFKSTLVNVFESSGLSIAGGLSLIYRWDNFQHGILYESVQYGAFVSSAVEVLDQLFLILGTSLSSSSLRNVESFPSHAWYVDTGLRYSFNESRKIIEIVLRENPSPDKGSTDVTLLLRYGF